MSRQLHPFNLTC